MKAQEFLISTFAFIILLSFSSCKKQEFTTDLPECIENFVNENEDELSSIQSQMHNGEQVFWMGIPGCLQPLIGNTCDTICVGNPCSMMPFWPCIDQFGDDWQTIW